MPQGALPRYSDSKTVRAYSLLPLRGAGRVEREIRNRQRNIGQIAAQKARQTHQRAAEIEAVVCCNRRDQTNLARQPPQNSMDPIGRQQTDVCPRFGEPWHIPAEMDDVTQTLFGADQNGPAAQILARP